MQDEKIHIATVGAPFGVRGAFRLKTLTEDPLDLLSYGDIYDESGAVHKFHKVRVENAHTLVVTSPSIIDRTQAELWRGRKFFVNHDQLPVLEDASADHDVDTFYDRALIGLSVISCHDGAVLGQVVQIANHGASDILIVKTESGESQIAFIKESVMDVSLDKKTVTVEPDHLI